jgi:glycosyltransferase involved in cell wall biosynthesis
MNLVEAGAEKHPRGSGRRLRVVTLIDGLGRFGGAEHLAMEVTKRLPPERFERTLAVTRWGPEQAAQDHVRSTLDGLSAAGVRFYGVERSSPLALQSWRPFLAFLRSEGIDVLHAHKFGSNAWGSVLGRLARTPVVIGHEHSWSFRGAPMRRLIDREVIARFSDVCITVSREDRRRMIEVERIPPEKIVFVPNGIEVKDGLRRHDVRAELGIPPADPLIGSIGTLRPQKAYGTLLRAAAMLVRERPRLRVLIAGDGPEGDRLRRLIDELGLGDKVLLLGRRSDVFDILGALDVAVCSSDFEGSPLAVMEYMEAAVPIVATSVGGIPDLIEDGVHGRLVAPHEPWAIAEAVSACLADPDRAREMGLRARERRRAEFDLSNTVAHLAELYDRLYREKTSAGRSPRG